MVARARYATHAEPTNEDMVKKLEWAITQRKDHKPTVPSTIADEKKTNPFLRVCMCVDGRCNAVAASFGAATDHNAMAGSRAHDS